MARNQWKEIIMQRGGGGEEAVSVGNGYLIFWLILVTFSVLSAMIFSCADGAAAVPRSKNDVTESSVYVGTGSACATACGAGCGA
ncbi:OLC1v1014127C1 [Oldenlandia corymbosa var. corymbosa]|uniref:OLC1v1014127C1 n=1 Tax=Oldenlandia corymbosa var. corymbosa TaxID=529605 RepID=A0AAV1E3A3_OLDCO|nr:OLC1v1014127C1 [Oldenlandia corymbosa var. corymbosa]